MIPFWKRLFALLVMIGVILLIPLIAMELTDEVDWGIGDFVLAGFLLFGIGVVFEFFIRRIQNKIYRGILIAFMLLCFLLLWAELGVGLFGSPNAGD